MPPALVLLPMSRGEGKTAHAVAWLSSDPKPQGQWSRVLVCSYRGGVDYIIGRVGTLFPDLNKRVMTVDEWQRVEAHRRRMYSPVLQVCLDDADELLHRYVPGLTRLTITAVPWES